MVARWTAGPGSAWVRRPPDHVATDDRTGDPRRRLEPLAVAGEDVAVAAAVLGVCARLPRHRILERDRRRVRARSSSRWLRMRTEVVLRRDGDVLHLRISGPRGLVDPRGLRDRGRELLAAVDAELRGRPVTPGAWLRR